MKSSKNGLSSTFCMTGKRSVSCEGVDSSVELCSSFIKLIPRQNQMPCHPVPEITLNPFESSIGTLFRKHDFGKYLCRFARIEHTASEFQRTIPAMMPKVLSLLPLAVMVLSVTGCNRSPGPGLEIHDTKYVAIGANGQQMETAMGVWPCTLDQYTGLMWQVKNNESGLHNWRNTYTWYNPEESNDPEGLDYRGTANGGQCSGSGCDTWDYVKAVNAAGYCGHNDWRVPLRDELASISDIRKIRTPPTINTQYFPHNQAGEYWTSNDYHFQFDAAWAWNFEFGHDRVDWKQSPKSVRLVRGEPLHLTRTKD